MQVHEKEIQILENIYKTKSHVRQRDLAEIAGLSLGMTNAILKRLVTKGLLLVKKVNNRNIKYIVSPEGVEAITKKSFKYFKRTIKNVVYYKESIDKLVKNAKKAGYTGIVLIGNSDLNFIVEHSCHTFKVKYVKNPEEFDGNIFHVYSESYIPENTGEETKEDTAYLQNVFLWV